MKQQIKYSDITSIQKISYETKAAFLIEKGYIDYSTSINELAEEIFNIETDQKKGKCNEFKADFESRID